jgi:hypothetical protein
MQVTRSSSFKTVGEPTTRRGSESKTGHASKISQLAEPNILRNLFYQLLNRHIFVQWHELVGNSLTTPCPCADTASIQTLIQVSWAGSQNRLHGGEQGNWAQNTIQIFET